MRIVECCIVTVLVTTLAASSGVAQSAAAAPAGVTRQITPAVLSPPTRDSSHTSLRTHMVRGGEIGGIAGLALGGLAVIVASESQCESFATSTPGLDSGCSNLSNRKAVQILVGGAVCGAVIGSVLGYAYHVNVNEQRAARCRATPTACA